MAIGKVGAYATVQAPNVDFGEVALNAQKFQDADLEKKKAVKPEKKAEDLEAKGFFVQVNSVTEASTDIINKNVSNFNKLKALEESGVVLTPKQIEEKMTSRQIANNIYQSQTEFIKSFDDLIKIIPDSSEVSSEYVNTIQALRAGKVIGYKQEGSNIIFRLPEVDDEGNVVLGEDGKPKPLMRLNKEGEMEEATVSTNDITSGKLLNNIYKKNDLNVITTDYAKNIGMYTIDKETGTVTIKEGKLTKSTKEELMSSISTDLRSDKKKTLDILSRITKNQKYRDILSKYKYNKERNPEEEEYVTAENYLFDQTMSKIDTSYSRTIDEPTQDGGGGSKGKKQPLGTVKVKNAFVYNNKGEVVGDLGKNASSEAIASGFDTVYETFDKYTGRPNEKGTEKTEISNAKVAMFFYDSSGNPTAMLEYQDVKGTGYTKEDVQDEADKLLKLFASEGKPLNRTEALAEAERKLSLSSESKGEENKYFSQNLNPRQYRTLLDKSFGSTVNGIKLDGTDETMRRATRATNPTTKPGVIKRAVSR